MYKIALISMPFATIKMPSIALTQLKSVIDSKFSDMTSVTIDYIHHDFGVYLGAEMNEIIRNESAFNAAGDWLFRQLAFPETEDNTEEYFQHIFPVQDDEAKSVKKFLLEKRLGLDSFLDELIIKYGINQVDLVGFSSTFIQNVASFAMAKKLKERNRNITIVMGGANCLAPMGGEIIKNIESIDFVFSGPGLVSFPMFIQYQLDQEGDKCHNIRGVYSKKNHHIEHLEHFVGDELDIDTKIELDYKSFLDSLDIKFPQKDKYTEPALVLETSRGCWWGDHSQCTFCGLNCNSINYRAMKKENAIDLFNSIFNYSSRCSFLVCVDNIMAKNYFKEVLPFLNTPPNMNIFYQMKANLTDNDFKELVKARVNMIEPGIESLSTSTLKLMQKGTTAFQNLITLKNCAMNNMITTWILLIGFPGEEEDVYKKYISDLPLLTHLNPPFGPLQIFFDRYGSYFKNAEKYGLDLKPKYFYEMIYPFSKESMANFAYIFVDDNTDAEYIKNMNKWIDKLRELIDTWHKLWDADAPHPIANLYFKLCKDNTLIHDSRTGTATEYRISENSRKALEYLNKPASIETLSSNMRQIKRFDAEEEIAFFKEKGLVFHENGRFMNLVLPAKPLKRENFFTLF